MAVLMNEVTAPEKTAANRSTLRALGGPVLIIAAAIAGYFCFRTTWHF